MKIKKNLQTFKDYNLRVKELLERHALLQVMVGQELYETAEEIINNYFECSFNKELTEVHCEIIADSVELSPYEEFRLEQDGKLYNRTITYYVLKELMYRGLNRYIKKRQEMILEAVG